MATPRRNKAELTRTFRNLTGTRSRYKPRTVFSDIALSLEADKRFVVGRDARRSILRRWRAGEFDNNRVRPHRLSARAGKEAGLVRIVATYLDPRDGNIWTREVGYVDNR